MSVPRGRACVRVVIFAFDPLSLWERGWGEGRNIKSRCCAECAPHPRLAARPLPEGEAMSRRRRLMMYKRP